MNLKEQMTLLKCSFQIKKTFNSCILLIKNNLYNKLRKITHQ